MWNMSKCALQLACMRSNRKHCSTGCLSYNPTFWSYLLNAKSFDVHDLKWLCLFRIYHWTEDKHSRNKSGHSPFPSGDILYGSKTKGPKREWIRQHSWCLGNNFDSQMQIASCRQCVPIFSNPMFVFNAEPNSTLQLTYNLYPIMKLVKLIYFMHLQKLLF